jgi:signal peptidase I
MKEYINMIRTQPLMKRVQREAEEDNNSIVGLLKKFWKFIWNDDSWQSWLVSLILAFVLIRFVFYPLIGLIMGTSMPIVAVISSSMEHEGDNWQEMDAYCSRGSCIQEEWYLEKRITPAEFEEFPFSGGFNKGDIMIIVGKKVENIDVGDVIVFEAGKNYPIIHRVVAIKEIDGNYFFETKGDNNPSQIVTAELDERNIPDDNIKGVAAVKIPYLGYIKIFATELVLGTAKTISLIF